jgi:hypothetical protein
MRSPRPAFPASPAARVVLVLLVLAGCGGSAPSQPPAATPLAPASSASPGSASPGSPPAASQDAPSSSAAHLPGACSDPASSVCTPPGDFVERLCAKLNQDAALALFSRETPFTRMYLRGRLDELDFNEEVLALRFHGPQKGGMVVGNGSGTYDVLRWDGTCSRGVEAEMLGGTRPGRPRSAHVPWHRIGAAIQDALIAGSDAVKHARARRGKECQGAMSGDVSKSCEAADQALVDAIVDYVRTHGGLPEPAVLP